MRETLQTALDKLYQACIWVSGLSIAVMALIIPWGVFTRYVLGTGSQWPEPIAIFLMMTFTFIGAAAAYRAGAHIAVIMLTERLPVAVRAVTGHLVHVLMTGLCLFVIWYGTHLCIVTWGQSLGELPWLPVGLTYASLPLGAVITLLFVAEHALLGPQAHRAVIDIDGHAAADRKR